MRISRKKMLINYVFIGSIFGSAGFAVPAGAQNAGAPASNQPVSVTAPPAQSTESIAAEQLSKRVKDALHLDPYFNDEHVTVSVEHGSVVLRGFVTSEWDLRDAIRIASTAAGAARVIDNLSIKLGGAR